MAVRGLASLVVVCISLGLVVSSAVAQTATAGAITSVTFRGTPARPTVTITGTGLRVPAPSPAVSPSNQPLCPKTIKGNAGLDYGTKFYVTASANHKPKFAAGRYRPKVNELDCIGIIVLAQTPTKIVFRFGAAYRQADFAYPHIVNGDQVQVVLSGAPYRLVVRYR